MFIFCHIMYILCCYYVYTFLLLCLYFVVTILLLFCYYFDSILITFFRKKSNIKKLKVFRVIWGGFDQIVQVYIYYSKTSILTTLPSLNVVLFLQTKALFITDDLFETIGFFYTLTESFPFFFHLFALF